MKKIALYIIASSALLVSACGNAEIGAVTGELKSAAQTAVGEAKAEMGLAPGGLLTTQNACLLAGQSEIFCGCLSTELGPELDASHAEGMGAALKATLGGDFQGALAQATTMNPETRTAIAKCGTRAAVAGAIGQ